NFETVCMAPCQADVDANGMYRVAGDGVTPSSTFGLGAPNGAMRLHVTAGSSGARIGGIWLLIGGITLAVTGGLTAGLFAAINDPYTDMTGWIVAGAVMAGVGVIMTAIGIPLIIGSGTSVVTDQGMPLAKRPSKPHLTLSGLVF
ncbi:MAG TPA: hypothetical protein VLM85_16175, partial [Polyangiaceae bacterium]|nr:hypothetical protein [Polyangiaceae bacterium]